MARLTGKCAGCGRSFEVLPAMRYGDGMASLPKGSAIGRSVCSRRCELVAEHKQQLVARGAKPHEVEGRSW